MNENRFEIKQKNFKNKFGLENDYRATQLREKLLHFRNLKDDVKYLEEKGVL